MDIDHRLFHGCRGLSLVISESLIIRNYLCFQNLIYCLVASAGQGILDGRTPQGSQEILTERSGLACGLEVDTEGICLPGTLKRGRTPGTLL